MRDGMDVFFRHDIRARLRALAAAGEANGPEYLLALKHVALAFGIEPEYIDVSRRETVYNLPPEKWVEG